MVNSVGIYVPSHCPSMSFLTLVRSDDCSSAHGNTNWSRRSNGWSSISIRIGPAAGRERDAMPWLEREPVPPLTPCAVIVADYNSCHT
jgi:hypothetical protein